MSSINTDLTQILSSRFANKWVALDSRQTKVIASGKSPAAVLKSAKKEKIKKPVITFVVEDYGFLMP